MFEANYYLYKILQIIGDIEEIKGENRFKVEAYRSASKKIIMFPEDIKFLYESEGLRGIKERLKVGDAIAEKIREFLETGKISKFESLSQEVPISLTELLKIRGIGPAKVRELWKMGITSIDDLEVFLQKGEAKRVFKDPSKVYEYLKFYKSQRDLLLMGEAIPLVKSFTYEYRSAIAVGAFRRGEPLIDVLEFAVSEDDAFKLAVSGRFEGGYWLWGGEKIPVKIHIYTEEDLGEVLVYSTGPEGHVKALLKLGDIKGETEEEVYDRLGLKFIHPFQRYDGSEVDLAIEGKLPKPVLPEDIVGDFHVHTTFSDGSMEIEEAILNAINRGYTVIGLADHSPSSGYAGGLNEERLREKYLKIQRLREKYPYMKILFATEVDIKSDGSLDYPDEVLKMFDLVIASVHNWKEDEDVTPRIISALKNPYVHIIAHPRGRVLKKRPSYIVDIDEVMRVAENEGKALEINANPKRVDLDAYALMDYKGYVSINTDAHRQWDMDFMFLGCAQASRARIPKEKVLNCEESGFLKKIV
ncbi:MAG: PHP domain-containing protein [candidate division WOR-3 bacterium]